MQLSIIYKCPCYVNFIIINGYVKISCKLNQCLPVNYNQADRQKGYSPAELI